MINMIVKCEYRYKSGRETEGIPSPYNEYDCEMRIPPQGRAGGFPHNMMNMIVQCEYCHKERGLGECTHHMINMILQYNVNTATKGGGLGECTHHMVNMIVQ
jgi:hypothetical protein